MEAKTSTHVADKAINKFGWAAIILASCIGAAIVIVAVSTTGII